MGHRNGKPTDRIKKKKRIYHVSYKDIYGKSTLTRRRLANELQRQLSFTRLHFFTYINNTEKKAAACIYISSLCRQISPKPVNEKERPQKNRILWMFF